MNTNKILIVMGMQNDFITGSLSTEEAREIVPYVKGEIEIKRRISRSLCKRYAFRRISIYTGRRRITNYSLSSWNKWVADY